MCHFLHPINILAVRPSRAKGSLRPCVSFPLSPLSPLQSSPSRRLSAHPLISPILVPLARLCGCDRPLLKIIYIFVFTQATRYFLIILLIDASFLSSFHGPLLFFSDLDARGPRTKITIDTDFCLRSLSLLENRRHSSSLPRGIPKGHHRARFVLRRRGRKRYRAISSRNHEYPFVVCLPLPPPFSTLFHSHLRITYVRLINRKKHTRVVKPLKSKNHNVFGTQASESLSHE